MSNKVQKIMRQMGKQITELGLVPFRQVMENTMAEFSAPQEIQREELILNGLKHEWFLPPEKKDGGCLLYLHGGGYNLGSSQTHAALLGHLSLACQLPVLAVNYRLAPENPFPAALEDAIHAYSWLLEEGYSPESIVLLGDSAGGGLALTTTLCLREKQMELPKALVTLSPWCDLMATGRSMMYNAGTDLVIQKPFLQQLASSYAPGYDLSNPLVSPLYADFKDFPPLLIQVSSTETLLDDSIRVTERIKAVGGEVRLEVWPELIHVWHLFPQLIPESQEAIDKIASFVEEQLSMETK